MGNRENGRYDEYENEYDDRRGERRGDERRGNGYDEYENEYDDRRGERRGAPRRGNGYDEYENEYDDRRDDSRNDRRDSRGDSYRENGKKKKKKNNTVTILIILAVILLCLIVGLIVLSVSKKEKTNKTSTATRVPETTIPAETTTSIPPEAVGADSYFYTSKGYLGVVKDGVTYIDGVLVANKTYALPENYGDGLTADTQAAFDRMAGDAAGQGLSVYIASGFRSYWHQYDLYNNYVARDGQWAADTYSARPGHSEHQTGLALDVNSVDYSFNGTAEAVWLSDNCWRYGFILRYPEGKDNETGYIYESWHFRYIGDVDLCQALWNNGSWLTVEDYFGITSVYAE